MLRGVVAAIKLLAVWQPDQPRAVTDVDKECGRRNPTLQGGNAAHLWPHSFR
jgi:hypothetical protein